MSHLQVSYRNSSSSQYTFSIVNTYSEVICLKYLGHKDTLNIQYLKLSQFEVIYF